MMSELQAFKDQDPEVIEAIKDETNTAHEAANRWTGQSMCRHTHDCLYFWIEAFTFSKGVSGPYLIDFTR